MDGEPKERHLSTRLIHPGQRASADFKSLTVPTHRASTVVFDSIEETGRSDPERYYYGVLGTIAPMVLVDRQHWTETLPAWPLLQSLARDRVMENSVFLVDTVEEASDLLLALI